jgi:chorismate dehydratase
MLRIGSVPYLNAKPLIDWFHEPVCTAQAEVIYAVPSELARMLRRDEIDVANVSIFEGFQNSDLILVPNISISAYSAVKSVRLFSRVPFDQILSVALDTSSLTSAALTRILLAETFGIQPEFVAHPPQLEQMLAQHDAGLIIGDLKLFQLPPHVQVYDLGQGWHDLTGLPFVYAAWLARADRVSPELVVALQASKTWGLAHLEELAAKWATRWKLPLDRCRDYLLHVMNYDLTPEQMRGLQTFQRKCLEHQLIDEILPLKTASMMETV